MKSLVNTFGGAVTHLEETFKTLEFPKIKKRILKYIKDNPEDSKTRIAWDTYSKGVRNTCRRKKSYVWYAEDLATGKHYGDVTSKKLAERIGTTQDIIRCAYMQGRLAKGHYKITRKEAPGGYRSPRPPKFTWIAEDLVTGELLTAYTALALANRVGTTEARVVVHRKKGQILDERYKITREKIKKAQ